MSNAKVLVIAMISLSLSGGTYAGFVIKGTSSIFYREDQFSPCDQQIFAEMAKLTSTGLPAGYDSVPFAKITSVMPTSASDCNTTVYFSPAG